MFLNSYSWIWLVGIFICCGFMLWCAVEGDGMGSEKHKKLMVVFFVIMIILGLIYLRSIK